MPDFDPDDYDSWAEQCRLRDIGYAASWAGFSFVVAMFFLSGVLFGVFVAGILVVMP